MNAKVDKHPCFLLDRRNSSVVDSAPVLQIVVNEVPSTSLNQKVHLIPIKVATKSLKSEVRPMSSHHTVLVLVVFDHSESIPQSFSVEEGVQRIS